MSHLGNGLQEVFSPSNLKGVLKNSFKRKTSFLFSDLLPDEYVDSHQVTLDIAIDGGSGLTAPTADSTRTPVVGEQIATGSKTFNAQEWREKMVFYGIDLEDIRRLGTCDEATSGKIKIQNGINNLARRLENRLEQMRVAAIVDGVVQFRPQGSATVTVNYFHPAYFQVALTGGDRWDQYATADPVQDMLNATRLWDDEPTLNTYDFIMRPETYNHIVNNDAYKSIGLDILKNAAVADLWRDDVRKSGAADRRIEAYISTTVGSGIRIHQYNGGYSTSGSVIANAAAAATTITVENAGQLQIAAGSKIKVVDRTNDVYFPAVVASVSGNVVTLTDPIPQAVLAGARVEQHVQFFDPTKVLVIAHFAQELADDSYDGTPSFSDARNPILPTYVGRTVFTRNTYDTAEENRRPGVFTKYIDRTQDDPPNVEILIGTKALPSIHYPEYYARLTVV